MVAVMLVGIAPLWGQEDSQEDPRLAEITIRQLLNHTAGWDSNQSFDPMFQSVRIAESLGVSPPALAEHVICFMKGHSLDFSPGERYAYSNLGYALLGRVIEAKAGQRYEEYVQKHVFSPLNIQRSRIGAWTRMAWT